MNNNVGKKAKCNFQNNFFKLKNNSNFGKIMENGRKHRVLNLLQQKEQEAIWCQS